MTEKDKKKVEGVRKLIVLVTRSTRNDFFFFCKLKIRKVPLLDIWFNIRVCKRTRIPIVLPKIIYKVMINFLFIGRNNEGKIDSGVKSRISILPEMSVWLRIHVKNILEQRFILLMMKWILWTIGSGEYVSFINRCLLKIVKLFLKFHYFYKKDIE